MNYLRNAVENNDVNQLLNVLRTYGNKYINIYTGNVPLIQRATINGNYLMVDILLQYGADPNLGSRPSGTTAFMSAISRQYFEIAKLLLTYEADPNICKEENEERALHILSKTPLEETTQEVINMMITMFDYGANPKLKNKKKQSPLHIACKNGNIYLVQRLVINGNANVNSRDYLGDTPLIIACMLENNYEFKVPIISLLLSHGAKPNIKGAYQKTALYYAIKQDDLDAVELLLNKGADPLMKTLKHKRSLKSLAKSEDMKVLLRAYTDALSLL